VHVRPAAPDYVDADALDLAALRFALGFSSPSLRLDLGVGWAVVIGAIDAEFLPLRRLVVVDETALLIVIDLYGRIVLAVLPE